MKFNELYNFYINEASDSLHQWFKRGGKDPKTGKPTRKALALRKWDC